MRIGLRGRAARYTYELLLHFRWGQRSTYLPKVHHSCLVESLLVVAVSTNCAPYLDCQFLAQNMICWKCHLHKINSISMESRTANEKKHR